MPTFIQMLTRFSRHAPRRSERSERSAFVLLTYQLLIFTYYFLVLACAVLVLACACLWARCCSLACACSCACLKYPTFLISHPISSQVFTLERASRSLSVRLPAAGGPADFFCVFLCFCSFWSWVSFFLRSWTPPRRFRSPRWPQVGSILEPCWSHFGAFLGAALASQLKTVLRCDFDRFLIDFRPPETSKNMEKHMVV